MDWSSVGILALLLMCPRISGISVGDALAGEQLAMQLVHVAPRERERLGRAKPRIRQQAQQRDGAQVVLARSQARCALAPFQQ